MMSAPLFLLAIAATGWAQAPDGYRTVYLTSKVNTRFVIVPTSRTSGSTVVVKTINNTPEQQWYIKDSNATTVQLANTSLCLDAGDQSNWKDMAIIYIKDCSDDAVAQRWFSMGDGRIALAESTSPKECVDLQYMRAVENNPVGIYNCAGLGGIGAADAGLNWPLLDATV